MEPGSPGDVAGLKEGDVVTAIDGAPVGSMEQLQRLVRRRRPGERVRLDVGTNGDARAVVVVLTERDA